MSELGNLPVLLQYICLLAKWKDIIFVWVEVPNIRRHDDDDQWVWVQK